MSADIAAIKTVDEAVAFFRTWQSTGRIGAAGNLLADEVQRLTGERDALRAAVVRIDAWARGNYGGAKSPAEVWPGLAAVLRAALTPDGGALVAVELVRSDSDGSQK